MNYEYVVIYKTDFGAKYSCIDVVAANIKEARNYALDNYSYLITKENIVKIVKICNVI